MSCLSTSKKENGRSRGSRFAKGGCLNDCHRVSMTNVELAQAASSSFALHQRAALSSDDQPSIPLDLSNTKNGVRFNLRKRPVSNGRSEVAMSSYNSAFLSGIFADIAKATNSQDDDPQLDEGISRKKSRVSMTRSISRTSRSYHNLAEVVAPVSPVSPEKSREVVKFFDTPAMTVQPEDAPIIMEATELPRHNSLTYQLNCVSSDASEAKASTTDLCTLAFPHLPATVSDQDLTQMVSSRHDSDTPKETYGWFVEMDAEDVHSVTDAYKTTTEDLAFSAHTAPKRVNMDAEVEWAKAADTVDDVLGDFF